MPTRPHYFFISILQQPGWLRLTMAASSVKMPLSVALIAIVSLSSVDGFAPQAFVKSALKSPQQLAPMRTTSTLNLFDPVSAMSMMDAIDTSSASASAFMESASSTMDSASTELLSFTDQGQNLAGIFFQASLLPYLIFLYFLSFRANRISDLGNFGFQFLLIFVLSTIPSGIVTKAVYGLSLANTDWLHGGAETLLTVANILVVLGFKEAMTNPNPPSMNKGRNIAFGIAATFFAALAVGPSLGVEGHSAFLYGLGDLPADVTAQLPWLAHTEPINALSIPTWAIHFSSVLEYLFAMNLVWKYSETTGNESWKGLTWGMLPLHASGACACTYHFFYNPSELQFLVSMQAGLTLLGNLTCAFAAYRIAVSNGWTLNEANPLPKSNTSPEGLVADGVAALPLVMSESKESTQDLALKLAGLTLATSYIVKYGELGIDLPFTPNPGAALAIVGGIPAVTAYFYYNKSKQDGVEQAEGSGFKLPSFGGGGGGGGPDDDDEKKGLSMADVKKYGVAGTVAYVITELAFWVVAFPVAATALYQSTGHWPDVVNDNTDRGAVLAFIFAGANVARLFVPVRLGVALALAPWVDDNLLNRDGTKVDKDDPDVIEADQKR